MTFLVYWFANSDCNFSVQSNDNVFLLETAGNKQFYSQEELKIAVKREKGLHHTPA
ncbi:MAG: hypothetical protein Q8934_17955 [Bacillota bacterium]|nr:hypothetical protein [Bacillota bacterium]